MSHTIHLVVQATVVCGATTTKRERTPRAAKVTCLACLRLRILTLVDALDQLRDLAMKFR